MGQGYEFTPLGPVPLGEGQAVWNRLGGDDVAGGVVAPPESAAERVYAIPREQVGHGDGRMPYGSHRILAAPRPEEEPPPSRSEKVTGKTLVAGARKRIRELDAILRTMPALQRERASLARLVAAANGTPKRARGRAAAGPPDPHAAIAADEEPRP